MKWLFFVFLLLGCLFVPVVSGADDFCLYFDGSGDYVYIGYDVTLDDFEFLNITFRLNPSFTDGYNNIVSKQWNSGDGALVIFLDTSPDTNRIVFTVNQVSGNSYVTYSLPLSLENSWFLVSCVFDRGEGVYIYVNGILKNSAVCYDETLSGVYTWSLMNGVVGSMDDFYIVSQDGMVCYFNFNEGWGNDIFDFSYNSNWGFRINALWCDLSYIPSQSFGVGLGVSLLMGVFIFSLVVLWRKR